MRLTKEGRKSLFVVSKLMFFKFIKLHKSFHIYTENLKSLFINWMSNNEKITCRYAILASLLHLISRK
jgi:hypothetical protein